MPVISFTLPVEDCPACCEAECPTEGDWSLTISSETECEPCRVTVNPVFFYRVDDASAVLGVWPVPVVPGSAVLTTVLMQQYEDECVTLDSEPAADVTATITCFDGEVTVSIVVEIPGAIEPTGVEVFQGTGLIGAVINNIFDCDSGQLPFFIGSVQVDAP